MFISAITSEDGLDEGEFMKRVDKVRPIGGTKNGKKPKIIKFTTQSCEEKVFFETKAK